MNILEKRMGSFDSLIPIDKDRLSVNKPACFLFPGMGTAPLDAKKEEIETQEGWDARLLLKRILQETNTHPESDAVNFFVATYDSDPEQLLTQVRISNMPTSYISEEAKEFVNECLLPLLDNNQPVTFVTTSYGGVVAEQIERALVEALKKRRMSDALIAAKMQTITQISVSSVSNIDPPWRDHRCFNTLHFQFSNDNIKQQLEDAGLLGYRDFHIPFVPKKKGEDVLDIQFLQNNFAVMTGYACPKYQKENSKGDLIDVDAPGQPHALRYLLDRQARATHGMYRAFINVLCASLNRNSPIIGETAEVINLREAMIRNPPFCRYIQDEREKKWLEEMLQDVPLNEEAGIQWTKQVGGRTTRPLYR